MQGFKEFIMRGNVIELAVAVIIGGAFTAIVTAVTDSLINPLIASFGSADVGGLGIMLKEGNEATFMDFGAIITAIINFLIIAAVVYFLIVMPMNKLNDAHKRRQGIDPDAVEPTESELLIEIRDLLQAERGIQTDTGNNNPRI